MVTLDEVQTATIGDPYDSVPHRRVVSTTALKTLID